MPILFRIDGDVLIETIVGAPSFAEFRQMELEAITHPTFRSGISILLDARRCKIDVSDELRSRSIFLTGGVAKISRKIAVVVTTSDFAFGSRVATYAGFEGLTLGFFTEINPAIKWLHETRPDRTE